MAKSLRSKWRRKMRREKTVRYGKKELARLLTMVEKAKSGDVDVKSAAEVVRATGKQEVKIDEEEMQVDGVTKSKTRSKIDLKTIINKNGTAPKWYHPRKVKDHKKKCRRMAKNKLSKK